MRKRRPIELFSITFLDLLSGALGAVIILYVAIPKNQITTSPGIQSISGALEEELQVTKEKVRRLHNELEVTQAKLNEAEKNIIAAPVIPINEDKSDLDIGFKFKGKNIVFVIDTSYSMIQEDRMGQVKAGLKMLITSLSGSYKVDVVQYPLGERAPFRSMWGATKNTTSLNKADIFNFIYSFRPVGGTPTRETLLFVLRNYEDITDIVLLSDGQPTYHNSNKRDDIYDILRVIREENINKVQINTIGVGGRFFNDKTTDEYKFLNLLAEDTMGFFVGF